MALNPSTVAGRVMKFASTGLPPTALHLISFRGREAISRPYRFEVEMVSENAEIDLVDVLQHPAHIGIKQGIPMAGGPGRGIRNLKIHGMLASFVQAEKVGPWTAYRAVLVPRLWKLSLNTHSRIFMEKTILEIVEQVLKDNGFTAQDYEFRATGRTYPKREYVVQYMETDLNFISRLLEHDGAFFYFQQEDEREKIIVEDHSPDCEPIGAPVSLPYRPQGTHGQGSQPVSWFDEESVRSFEGRAQMIPSQVTLQDYNWRTPSVALKVSTPVVPTGYGTQYEYGDHYKDEAEGQEIAKARAEERKCRQRIFAGTSDCRALRTGFTFRFADHYRFNGTYLLTEVVHEAAQHEALGAGPASTPTYRNEFVAIPADEKFRPERLTPKPRIAGTINARVDGAGSAQYAEIDDQGRYKVKFPFDLTGKNGGQASRYVRMAQPYAGAEMGMHFPLHKGTEVALGFTNGDPDRPFIVGAIPNPETGSMVAGGNQTQCKIQTGGGNKLVLEDTDGKQQIALSCPKENTFFKMGDGCVECCTDGPHDETCKGSRSENTHVNRNTDVGGNEHGIIHGLTHWEYHGANVSIYLATKTQIVGGLQFYLIGGAFLETVVGAIVHTGLAIQIHKTAGPHLWENPVTTIHAHAMIYAHAGAEILMMSPSTMVCGDVDLMLHSGGSHIDLVPGMIKMTTPVFNATATGAADLKGADVTVEATGGLFLGGALVDAFADGELHLRGSPVSVLSKSGLTLKGSSIKIDGPVDANKAMTVEGRFVVTGAIACEA